MARQVNGHLGTFDTIATLTARFPPEGSIGCSANIGATVPYNKAWCNGDTWDLVNASLVENLTTTFILGDSYSWNTLPSPYTTNGLTLYVRDVGIGGSVWRSDGTQWVPANGGQIVLAHQAWQCDAATDSTTNEVELFSYILPPLLWGANSTLQVSAKASWPGSSTVKNLSLYLDSTRLALTTNGGNASVVSAKWEGLELNARLDNLSSQIGEANDSSGDNARQTVAFNTSSANPTSYREISIRGSWGTAGAGSNKITLESAMLILAWGG
jgi:hypothetical protein